MAKDEENIPFIASRFIPVSSTPKSIFEALGGLRDLVRMVVVVIIVFKVVSQSLNRKCKLFKLEISEGYIMLSFNPRRG